MSTAGTSNYDDDDYVVLSSAPTSDDGAPTPAVQQQQQPEGMMTRNRARRQPGALHISTRKIARVIPTEEEEEARKEQERSKPIPPPRFVNHIVPLPDITVPIANPPTELSEAEGTEEENQAYWQKVENELPGSPTSQEPSLTDQLKSAVSSMAISLSSGKKVPEAVKEYNEKLAPPSEDEDTKAREARLHALILLIHTLDARLMEFGNEINEFKDIVVNQARRMKEFWGNDNLIEWMNVVTDELKEKVIRQDERVYTDLKSLIQVLYKHNKVDRQELMSMFRQRMDMGLERCGERIDRLAEKVEEEVENSKRFRHWVCRPVGEDMPGPDQTSLLQEPETPADRKVWVLPPVQGVPVQPEKEKEGLQRGEQSEEGEEGTITTTTASSEETPVQPTTPVERPGADETTQPVPHDPNTVTEPTPPSPPSTEESTQEQRQGSLEDPELKLILVCCVSSLIAILICVGGLAFVNNWYVVLKIYLGVIGTLLLALFTAVTWGLDDNPLWLAVGVARRLLQSVPGGEATVFGMVMSTFLVLRLSAAFASDVLITSDTGLVLGVMALTGCLMLVRNPFRSHFRGPSNPTSMIIRWVATVCALALAGVLLASVTERVVLRHQEKMVLAVNRGNTHTNAAVHDVYERAKIVTNEVINLSNSHMRHTDEFGQFKRSLIQDIHAIGTKVAELGKHYEAMRKQFDYDRHQRAPPQPSQEEQYRHHHHGRYHRDNNPRFE